MSEPGSYSRHDIRNASFEDFVTFLFDHEVVPVPRDKNAGPFPWYWSVRVDYDPRAVIAYYTRLFTAPRLLLAQFTVDQLEQGFWAIQGPVIDCSVSEVIWERAVPFESRESCVRAMFDLFAQLFDGGPLESSVGMWWDSLAFDWECGNRSRSNGGEDQLMQDVMFATLARILDLQSESCQAAALHGLGHLHHPETAQLIQGYLGRNTTISADLRDYALAAARFEVM
jgi:hypothetical protein